MNPKFIPGLKLAEMFFEEIVKEIIKENFPNLRFTACLIGPGSEVLGYDDKTSTDHHWGLRLQLFLSDDDYEKFSEKLIEVFKKNLPYHYKGYSTNWGEPNPDDNNTQLPQEKTKGEVNHRIEICTTKRYLKEKLAIDSLKMSEKEWLLLPDQSLLEFTQGKLFYDTLGELKEARKRVSYFPENVWKFKILSEWEHIKQEIAFHGRTGEVKDELGSRVEASRLVRYIMRLAIILSKKYLPYEKWLGTTFSRLQLAEKLEPVLLHIFNEKSWKKRDKLLCDAYLLLVEEQNKLRLTPKIKLKPKPYFNRKQLVIDVDLIMKELSKQIQPPLKNLKPFGTISQILEIGGGISPIIAKKAGKLYE
ncbi:MAG: DUF4037 domain-containing protein [Candidatus Heimdallarchaeaceae archaeon]